MVSVLAPAINIPSKLNSSPKTKKNVATVSLVGLASAGAIGISKSTFGKSFKWNTAINKTLKGFAKSSKEFFGAEPLKKFAGKLAKTTARQKLLGALAIGTVATVMAVREHFSKKEGVENQKKLDAVKVRKINNAYNDKIDKLETDILLKDADITALNSTIEAIDKAADKIGVSDALAKELIK